MISEIPQWVVEVSPGGLLTIVVVMILLGWLIPRRTFQYMERDRDHWRDVALLAMGQNAELITAARITAEVTRVLSEVGNDPEAT